MITDALIKFLDESNAIEGIYSLVTADQKIEASRFLALEKITIADLERFVDHFQPGAKLRDKSGLDVKVGSSTPELGGPFVRKRLQLLLDELCPNYAPFRVHQVYENLHPFMDCNGRSGRILWLWQMEREGRKMAPLGFLQTLYYQSLGEEK